MILSSTWSTAPDFVSLDGKYYESRSSSSLSDLLRRPRCCSSQSFGATQTEAAVRFFTYRSPPYRVIMSSSVLSCGFLDAFILYMFLKRPFLRQAFGCRAF
jgi:hypothetical protein